MDEHSEGKHVSWESAERAVPLRQRLADAGIDPVDYAETVNMAIDTVLYADVSASAWDDLLAEYREKAGQGR